ncbi:hypothetical protein DOK_17395 [gamma proteobacterium BDW918]|mgnify:CR=1 FL=1|jgi:predicted DNA-binding transcriptional regulator AlpA|uniref:Uncharacterized protein n=1 Tax=Zhongshania aliphaticivorans TaxID=1470434 RepID=A0A127MA08_9GAMM|nr:hypothetical protein AZF00_17905 [Zhongshania aliphaticivorans]EIF41743.1 hypothetical protein DOK_17395 [gamma proteobacterium BDW918]|tara:strand:+ start:8519 stop:8716 length:198 start_codon:yes stop_codon:yes gene_type:complete
MPEEKIFHITDLMKILGVSRTTIWRFERDGDIPPSRYFARGKIKGWTRDDLNKILESSKSEANGG